MNEKLVKTVFIAAIGLLHFGNTLKDYLVACMGAGNTKGGCIAVPLTSCWTGLQLAV